MSGNDELLKAHIMSLSLADDYLNAKKEWTLVDIEYDENGDHCPCGHKIKEKCYIHNRFTNKDTYVGNICINKFLGIDTGKAFAGLKQIIENNYKIPNEDLIGWAYELGYIDDKDKNFIFDIKKNNKKKLSNPQVKWLNDINNRIIKKRKKRR